MNHQTFLKSLELSEPPAGISLVLQALWHDAQENWEEAHRLIQDEPGILPGRIHAYLHRKEGDQFNAGYWYRKAGVNPFSGSFQAEWEMLVETCLGKS